MEGAIAGAVVLAAPSEMGGADYEKNSQALILENRESVVDFVDDGEVLYTQITEVGGGKRNGPDADVV